jgi:hypothetical protein
MALFAASVLTLSPARTPATFATHGAPFPFCVDGKAYLYLTGSGPAGETDTW